MSNFHFGVDDYDLNYHPSEAGDGMGGVDWDKVESVEIECDVYVKERTCKPTEPERCLDGTDCPAWLCSECGELFELGAKFCSNCGAKVVER